MFNFFKKKEVIESTTPAKVEQKPKLNLVQEKPSASLIIDTLLSVNQATLNATNNFDPKKEAVKALENSVFKNEKDPSFYLATYKQIKAEQPELVKFYLEVVQSRLGSDYTGPIRELEFPRAAKTSATNAETKVTEEKIIVPVTFTEKINHHLSAVKEKVESARSEHLSGGEDLIKKLRQLNTFLFELRTRANDELNLRISQGRIDNNEVETAKQYIDDITTYGKNLTSIIDEEVKHLPSLDKFSEYK